MTLADTYQRSYSRDTDKDGWRNSTGYRCLRYRSRGQGRARWLYRVERWDGESWRFVTNDCTYDEARRVVA